MHTKKATAVAALGLLTALTLGACGQDVVAPGPTMTPGGTSQLIENAKGVEQGYSETSTAPEVPTDLSALVTGNGSMQVTPTAEATPWSGYQPGVTHMGKDGNTYAANPNCNPCSYENGGTQ